MTRGCIVCNNGIIRTPKSDFVPDPRGTGSQYFRALREFQERVFQIDALTGGEDTYGDVLQRSVRMAMALQSRGVSRGDLIGVCSLNTRESAPPIFASLFVGASLVFLDPLMPISDAMHVANQIDPKLFFVADDSVAFLSEVLESSKKMATIITIGESEYLRMLQPRDGEDSFSPIDIGDLDSTAFVYFSSGSTGLPKRIVLSHRAYLVQVGVALDMDICCERILYFSRLYCARSSFIVGLCILKGAVGITLPKFEPAEAWKAIRDCSPTFMFLSTYAFTALCNEAPIFDTRSCSLKAIIATGNKMYEHQLLEYRKIFPKAVVTAAYGLTEIGLTFFFPSSTAEDLQFVNTKTKSIGKVIRGISYKVVDVETERLLGPQELGELRLKSSSLMTHDTISATWDSDGWFRTGDIVSYDEDFYFYYSDRAKEMITFRHWTLSSKSLEDLILAHPKVSGVCVFGVPNDNDIEHPMAVVTLRGTRKGFEDELCRYVELGMPDMYRLRGGVRVVEKFPETTTGKIDKRTLKKMFIIAQ